MVGAGAAAADAGTGAVRLADGVDARVLAARNDAPAVAAAMGAAAGCCRADRDPEVEEGADAPAATGAATGATTDVPEPAEVPVAEVPVAEEEEGEGCTYQAGIRCATASAGMPLRLLLLSVRITAAAAAALLRGLSLLLLLPVLILPEAVRSLAVAEGVASITSLSCVPSGGNATGVRVTMKEWRENQTNRRRNHTYWLACAAIAALLCAGLVCVTNTGRFARSHALARYSECWGSAAAAAERIASKNEENLRSLGIVSSV